MRELVKISKEFNDFIEKNNIIWTKTTEDEVELKYLIEGLINNGLIIKKNFLYSHNTIKNNNSCSLCYSSN
jgi:hypothetical protein